MTGGTLLQNQMVSESIAELSLGMDRAAEVENEQETLVNDRALGKQDLGQLPNAMDALLLKLDYNRHYALRS